MTTQTEKINLGIVGVGKWGKNYLKLADKFNVNFKIGDRSNENNWKNLKDITGVIIATPPDSHVEIAKHFLEQDIPVMIEKPLCLSAQEAESLSDYKTPILVNHLHLFSPAFEEITKQCKLGRITQIKSVGTGDGPHRDYSSLYDYGSHDLSMGLFLSSEYLPKVEEATENDGTYNVKLKYSNYTHYFKVSNNNKKKQRYLTIIFIDTDDAKKHIIYSDVSEGKLFIFGKTFDGLNKISTLENSFSHFLNAVKAKMGLNNYIMDDRFGVDLSVKMLKLIKQIEEVCKTKHEKKQLDLLGWDLLVQQPKLVLEDTSILKFLK